MNYIVLDIMLSKLNQNESLEISMINGDKYSIKYNSKIHSLYDTVIVNDKMALSLDYISSVKIVSEMPLMWISSKVNFFYYCPKPLYTMNNILINNNI